jgi:hypothetical protein
MYGFHVHQLQCKLINYSYHYTWCPQLLRESTYIGYAWCAIPLDIVFMHLFNKIFELNWEILIIHTHAYEKVSTHLGYEELEIHTHVWVLSSLIWNRHRLKSSRNRYQSWLLGNFRYTRRSENGRVVTIGPDALRYQKLTQPLAGDLRKFNSKFLQHWTEFTSVYFIKLAKRAIYHWSMVRLNQ